MAGIVVEDCDGIVVGDVVGFGNSGASGPKIEGAVLAPVVGPVPGSGAGGFSNAAF